ncbi:flagellar biosynthesis protein FlhB [Acuticoccus sp. MNP-M23]|uniref:flagellar biosynthesis protein FlhB n=1 Tax=Acuticoccus sp. MNP-M23 TaxID=3072793 RepID=UPI002814DCED|nr:flagellar biosynthesis protein FlhB [Acuticoccus sp. MNP-M23]WMS41799.1 flagellar biosynthesis protein FlhB [Acuticoccus sp. MNP-M23]
MSDKPDSSERTEEPTPKKIEDALNKGQTPFSREAPTFASLLALLIVLGVLVTDQTRDLVTMLAQVHDSVGVIDLNEGTDATALFMQVYRASAMFLIPIVILLAIFGVIAAIAQTPPRVVGERIRPKMDRISIKAGFKRMFGSPGLMEFGRSLFKFAAVASVAVFTLSSQLPMLVRSVFVDPVLLPQQILSIATRLLSAVCTVTILLVAIDLVYTRMKWRRDLKMSRQEVKDELKQSEGDPIVKSRIRSAQKNQARKRMLTAVPQATVVIANPTHYAVALAYERGAGGAPKVIAKGLDLVALKIREVAEKNEIPVIEDPPLARALYAAADVDHAIPEEFFRAVAQVLYFVYSHDTRGTSRAKA